MSDQIVSAEALARPHIERCRREIDAAQVQIEAAKDLLRRSRYLIERWAERSRIDELHWSERLNSSDRSEAARIGMFVLADPEPKDRRPRGGGAWRKHQSRRAPMARAFHSRPRSASG